MDLMVFGVEPGGGGIGQPKLRFTQAGLAPLKIYKV